MTKEQMRRVLASAGRSTTVFDCDGTATESLHRRYQCYLEAWEILAVTQRKTCERLAKQRRAEDQRCSRGDAPAKPLARFDMPEMPQKLSFEQFCQAYRTSDNITDFMLPGILLPTGERATYGEEYFATMVSQVYERQVGMYTPTQLAADRVPENLINGARALCRITAASIVSFRRMRKVDFLTQLRALGLINDSTRGITDLFNEDDVNLVGADGVRPYEAKIAFIRAHYAEYIRAQAEIGVPVALVGDSVHDFKVVLGLLDLGPVQFVGVTETGEADRRKFLEAFHEARHQGLEFPEPQLFASIGDPACIAYFEGREQQYRLAREAFLRQVQPVS